MAHPQMFDDGDPTLARVREMASTLPGAAEKVSHGRPAFFTIKVFTYFGGALKVDGEWVQHPRCIVVLPGEDDRRALLEDGRGWVPGYLGASGWVGLDLPPLSAAAARWDEIAELIDASYRATAVARLVAELDAREEAPER